MVENRSKVRVGERLGQTIHGPLWGGGYNIRECRVEAVREGQEAEKASQRGRQDGNRSRLQMTCVASEIVLKIRMPQPVGDRRGIAEVSVEKLSGVSHAVDAGMLGHPAGLHEEVVILSQERAVRSWRWQESSRVLLIEHSQQMVDGRPARDQAAGEANRA